MLRLCRRSVIIALLLTLGAPPTRAASPDDLSPRALPQLAARVLPAVVNVSGLKTGRPPGATRTLGSGFIIDAGGLVATNQHVIDGLSDITVTLQDNTVFRATVQASAPQVDIALLKINPVTPLPTLAFGDSDVLRVADPVVAIGNPLGLGGSVTVGIVSALNRDIRDTPYDDFIQTDAAINHGNSGGPLFNLAGQVIGINTAIFSPTAESGSIGIGFAIPANDAKFVIDRLRSFGRLRAGSLEFRMQQVTPEIADALGLEKAEGVIVADTEHGSDNKPGGLVPGDIVLKYGHADIKDVRALSRMISRTPVGQSVDLTIIRDEEPLTVAVSVHEMMDPGATAMSTAAAAAAAPATLGWDLGALTPPDRETLHLDERTSGVIIRAVSESGPAADAGMVAGDLIVRAQLDDVASPADVEAHITTARSRGHRFAILLIRNATGLRWVSIAVSAK